MTGELCSCEDCDDTSEGCMHDTSLPRCHADTEAHGCPYQEDVNDDHEFACNCCPCRTQQCVWDI